MYTTHYSHTPHLRLLLMAAFVLCAAASGFAQTVGRFNRNGTDEVLPDRVQTFTAAVIDADGISHPVGDLKVIPMGVLSPKEQEAALDHDLMTKMKETYGPGMKAVEEFQKQKALRMQQEQPK